MQFAYLYDLTKLIPLALNQRRCSKLSNNLTKVIQNTLICIFQEVLNGGKQINNLPSNLTESYHELYFLQKCSKERQLV